MLPIIKKIFALFIVLYLTISFANAQITNQSYQLPSATSYSFIICSDLGRNGYDYQKTVAEAMSQWVARANIKFIIAAGDVHHFNGVASINDPLWMTNFELVYAQPELMIEWYPILGNHEYRGNTAAVINYSKVSRRWVMPNRFYTITKKIDDNNSILLLLIDTTPIIDKYRNDRENYPDAALQDYNKQLYFIDSTLNASKERWKIVIGHHPIYAQTLKEENERKNLQDRLDPILKKNNVDFYFSGHIHNFQHISSKNSKIEYIVNSSGSTFRDVLPLENTKFCSAQPGFTICSVSYEKFLISFINNEGEIIYSYEKTK